jgi:2-keto-4-pentenoate hydratase/2-oxohepta-3-ene-1,7-dioic acid hydratase in catechol pathway
MDHGKIIGLGKNYQAHAEEMKEILANVERPVVFLKPSSALLFEPEPIRLPAYSRNVHHELELVVEIGRMCKEVTAQYAWRHIRGYRIGLDLTARDVQQEAKRNGWPWALGKSFDTAAPVSRLYRLEDVDGDIAETRMMLKVNGEVRQDASTADMTLAVPEIIEYLSAFFTLDPGDLIFTGTPAGVGPIQPGDELVARIGALGEMTVRVAP